jgi:hypothetical protein
MLDYNFKDFNGKNWPSIWVDTYNRLTREIEACTHAATKELLLNDRHRFFVDCMLVAKEV